MIDILKQRLLTAVLALGVILGAVLVPSPAAAHHEPAIIPPDGWCYNNWYVAHANLGSSIQRYGNIKSMHNQTSQSVQWSESITVQHTFSTTYNFSASFQGGFDIWIVKSSIQAQLGITTVDSKSVTETSGWTVTVPPHTSMFAEYGAWQQESTGTYYQEQYSCIQMEHSDVTNGAVTVKSLTGEVGWRLWQS